MPGRLMNVPSSCDACQAPSFGRMKKKIKVPTIPARNPTQNSQFQNLHNGAQISGGSTEACVSERAMKSSIASLLHRSITSWHDPSLLPWVGKSQAGSASFRSGETLSDRVPDPISLDYTLINMLGNNDNRNFGKSSRIILQESQGLVCPVTKSTFSPESGAWN